MSFEPIEEPILKRLQKFKKQADKYLYDTNNRTKQLYDHLNNEYASFQNIMKCNDERELFYAFVEAFIVARKIKPQTDFETKSFFD